MLDPRGSYILIGHDAFGASGHGWLGSIPRMLGLVARSAVSPQLRVVVDRSFPLDQTPQAMRHLMSGQIVGRVVLRLDD